MTEVDSEPIQPIKIAIITHEDFAVKHSPPYPRPCFISFESPLIGLLRPGQKLRPIFLHNLLVYQV
jgi:hypothetical protein